MCGIYCTELLTLKDATQAAASDHTIMQIISKNSPPFSTDPRILEWAKHKATVKRTTLMVQIKEKARAKAEANYDTFLTVAELKYTNDIEAVHKNYNKCLAQACKKWESQLISLKANLKAQYQEKKATLEHNCVVSDLYPTLLFANL